MHATPYIARVQVLYSRCCVVIYNLLTSLLEGFVHCRTCLVQGHGIEIVVLVTKAAGSQI